MNITSVLKVVPADLRLKVARELVRLLLQECHDSEITGDYPEVAQAIEDIYPELYPCARD